MGRYEPHSVLTLPCFNKRMIDASVMVCTVVVSCFTQSIIWPSLQVSRMKQRTEQTGATPTDLNLFGFSLVLMSGKFIVILNTYF